ncbi:M23 family metallopeptidase [Bacillus pseudomycoides]|uniref:M23 family metallopeptidase n=1 Tax=Bacillus pseudomycoides TaxID=64104 RepID=UPI001FB2CD67|nr:M23 family metallopeptidase [Bacillus pseudomycoides]
MESGVVADIRRVRPHCDTSDCPMKANNVVLRGSDGYFTEYAHITPAPFISQLSPPRFVPLRIGHQIKAGQLLGWVDSSGHTEGAPVIHITRFNRLTPGGELATYDGFTCDWYIVGVDALYVPLECMPQVTPHGYHPWQL